MSSYGDFIALSAPCDLATARIISREVSDGVVAPGYSPEALEILGKKKGGKYCVLQVRLRVITPKPTALILDPQIDPNYVPGGVETRQVYGVSLQQKRNDAKIDAKVFETIVSQDKNVKNPYFFLPFSPLTQDIHLASRKCRNRSDRRNAGPKVHPVQQRSLCIPRLHNRTRRRATVSHPLHAARRLQSRQLVAAPPPAHPRTPVQERSQARGQGKRDRPFRWRRSAGRWREVALGEPVRRNPGTAQCPGTRGTCEAARRRGLLQRCLLPVPGQRPSHA